MPSVWMRSREWRFTQDCWLPGTGRRSGLCFPASMDDANGEEDEGNERGQPCLPGMASSDAKDGIEEPENGEDEPDGRTAHFFSENSRTALPAIVKWSKLMSPAGC